MDFLPAILKRERGGKHMKIFCGICHKLHEKDESCPSFLDNPISPLHTNDFSLNQDLFPKIEPEYFGGLKFEAKLFPEIDPIIIEKPKFELDIFPKIESSMFEKTKNEPDYFPKIDPIIPPPSPVINLNHDTLGWKPEFDNHIYTGIGGNGPRLTIDTGGLVRDQMDNLIGQMGPMNTICPPDLPQMPDYGPPQSDPGAWDPGYSPMGPVY
jgi:hypothetical protein